MYQVKLTKHLCLWVLSIETSEQVLWAYTANRYIDVLGIAQALQLNVDIDESLNLTKGY